MEKAFIWDMIVHPYYYTECKYCGKINLAKNTNCIACDIPLKGVSLETSGTLNGYIALFSEEDMHKITIEV
jgi:uncharacterized OB-fold protein